jgi:hypothetical protein
VYFGSRFYGSHYYGPHYWGTAGAVPAGPTPGVFSLLEQGVAVTAPKAYQVGDLIRLGIEVRNLDNALVDATMSAEGHGPGRGCPVTYTDATSGIDRPLLQGGDRQ